tara:strand:+ start:637 stop:1743 length:1107 start_codon:yes stop_codon:yes gene_type:complete
MKKIIFKKISIDIAYFFLLAIFSLGSIIWVLQAVNFLDIVVEDGHGLVIYLYYTLLSLPKILSKILPFALFFSFFYIFLKYENNNELLIFWNFGISKKKFVNYFLRLSFLFLLVQFTFTIFLVPNSQNIARSFIKNSNVDLFEGMIREKKFIDTFLNLTIYVERKNSFGELENVFLKDNTTNQITFAEKGIFEIRSNEKLLVLYDGKTIAKNGKQVSNIEFKKTDFNISKFTSKTTMVTKTQENSTIELINCLYNFEKTGEFSGFINCRIENKKNIIEELYKRLVLPLYFPTFILIALMLTIKSKEENKFNTYKLFIFLLGVIVLIFSEISIKLITINLHDNINNLMFPFIIFITLYSIFFYKIRFKK